jgi:hypothetical protein
MYGWMGTGRMDVREGVRDEGTDGRTTRPTDRQRTMREKGRARKGGGQKERKRETATSGPETATSEREKEMLE